jgi:thiamine pyrophosphate-dependent acetolactate synthase large subunit-like protein
MKIYEAIANALVEEGVDTVFGLMGDGNLRLLNYWSGDLGQRYYGTRHEAEAVAMADGFARASGSLGVCTVTQGPGVTNSLTALINARKARTPILFMMGDVASFQQGWPQDVDHSALLGAAGIPIVQLGNPATAFSDVLRAIRTARVHGTPVGLNMPTDVQEREWNAWEDETTLPDEPVELVTPAADQLAAAAQVLLDARRPVIIAGRGAVEADCAEELVSIGERVGALFATTLRGKGIFGSREFYIGTAGGLGSNSALQLIGAADVVLVVGAAMNDFTAMRGQLLSESCTAIHCDIDASRVERLTQTEYAFVMDAKQFTQALDAELSATGRRSPGYRARALEQMAGFDPRSEYQPSTEPGMVDPRDLCIRLDELLPADRLVVTDAGHFFGYPVAYVNVPDGRSFICGIDFGSIGLGIGLAMGAAIAKPDQPPVLFAGDGGAMMSLGDLDTVTRYGIPLTIVVMNDAAYGSELQILRLWDLPTELSTFPETDFSAIAESLGITGTTIRSLEDLEALAKEHTWGASAILLDCRISRSVCAAWLEEAFRH